MEYKLTCVVSPEHGVYTARCLDHEVTSAGASEREAVANLWEAVKLYLEGNSKVLRDFSPKTYRLAELVLDLEKAECEHNWEHDGQTMTATRWTCSKCMKTQLG
jgi:predicted RNase H-like HicB family nuclease